MTYAYSCWFHLDKLTVNTDKTIAISFHSWQNKNNLKPKIVFQDMDVKYKNDTKFLGLYLTEDVKWDVHRKHVSDILNKSYYVIQSLKTVTSVSTLRSIQGPPKKMYTHCNKWYLCIVFEVELNYHYSM
jgi:hypothetical protein